MSSKKSAKTVTIQLRPVDRSRVSTEQQQQQAGPSNGQQAPPVKAVTTKSRYKIYEIPRKSEFSEYLERIRREQEVRQERDANQRQLQAHDQEAGPSQRTEPPQKLLVFDKPITVMRQGSVVEYRLKKRHPFKELLGTSDRRVAEKDDRGKISSEWNVETVAFKVVGRFRSSEREIADIEPKRQ
uniref:Uncharacterized protein n=1 Tax=Anopheles minimus TaxID=112268 RepID=A0A182WMS2_9DIPT